MTEEHFGKILGYRNWSIHHHQEGKLVLHSQGPGGLDWVPGTNEAKCKGVELGSISPTYWWEAVHRPAGAKCECGLYAWHDFVQDTEWSVAGAVLGWGKTQVHPGGFRSEYMEPIALAWPAIPGFEKGFPEAAESLRECAAHYGCLLVPRDDLEKTTKKLGKPIPKELRPAMPSPEPLHSTLTSTGMTAAMMKQQLYSNSPLIQWSSGPPPKKWGGLRRRRT